MPLDPQARALLDEIAAMGLPPLESMTVDQARAAGAAMGAFHGEPAEIAAAEDRLIPGSAANIPIRIYVPHGDAPFPALVYFHGGGWVIGSIETHDGVCRDLCHHARCIVVSVDYRLAPEHKFPAALDDAYSATWWVAHNAVTLDVDPRAVAVGGDSAGGNLAAAVALMARDKGEPPLRFQLLAYPALDAACDTPSAQSNADGYFLTTNAMRWFWNHYLRDEDDRSNPYACPPRAADLRGLPPALVITAEFDPLRDEAETYAARLRDAGVSARTARYDGMIHGFLGMGGVLRQGKQAIKESAEALKQAFATAR